MESDDGDIDQIVKLDGGLYTRNLLAEWTQISFI